MSATTLSEVKPSRIEALKQKHAALSARVDDAQRSPSTTDFYLKQLKRQKLEVKEMLEGIAEGEGSRA